MNNKLKKILLSVLSIGTVTGAVTITAACGKKETAQEQSELDSALVGNYDFGIAVSPINNLNYVKEKGSLSRIMPNIVQGLWKNGPTKDQNMDLQLPELKYLKVEEETRVTPGGTHDIHFSTNKDRYFVMSNLYKYSANVLPGSSIAYEESTFAPIIKAFYANLNGKQNWKGDVDQKFKRVIVANDYIDYVKYVMDISTGSKNLQEIRELKIQGLEELYQAQIEYKEKFGHAYKYPFGKDIFASDGNLYSNNSYDLTAKIAVKNIQTTPYYDPIFELEKNDQNTYWPKIQSSSLQNDEGIILSKIRQSAIDFLTEGMITYSGDSWEHEHSDWKYTKNTGPLDESKFQFDSPDQVKEKKYREENRAIHLAIYFDQSLQKESPFGFFSNTSNLLPINKEFIESIGGITNFGNSLKEFIYSSPFNITDLKLEKGGYISLEKDDNWFASKTVVPQSFKIYFQDDPELVAKLFKDGYITWTTDINDMYKDLFWSQNQLRPFMEKYNGTEKKFLQLNIDYSKKSPLNNEYFRNALSHSIDKNSIIESMGSNSFPSSLWTPISNITSSDGIPIEIFYDLETFTPELSNKTYSISSTTWAEFQSSLGVYYEIDKNDPKLDIALAHKYFEEFKKQSQQNKFELIFLANDDLTEKAGTSLKDQLNKAFDGQINLIVKKLSGIEYQNEIKAGNYDLTISDFASFAKNIKSYFQTLLFPHPTNLNNHNPTGGWTFYQWFTDKFGEMNDAPESPTIESFYNYIQTQHPEIIAFAKDFLNIDLHELDATNKNDFNDLGILKTALWLISTKDTIISSGLSKNNPELQSRFNQIYTGGIPYISSDINIFRLTAILEKIIAISAPIIPISEAFNWWSINKLKGITSTIILNFEFASAI